MTIIALAGRRYSGKGLAGNLIVSVGEDMNIPIRQVAFADPIREMFSASTGIATRMLLAPETKEEFRQPLIEFATQKRKQDPMVFINALFKTITQSEHIVIDDMRTIEELQAVLKVGGKPFKVYASASVRESRGYKYNPVVDNGLLETEMDLSGDTFRVLGGGQIFNTGSQAYLKSQLFDLVKREFCRFEVLA